MSGFSWKQSAEGGATSEKIPAGQNIAVKVGKVVYSRKGKPMASKAGDPQIGVIFRDDKDREAMLVITLSPKGAWVLSRLLSRFGYSLDVLERDGILPQHFAEKSIADPKLIGLQGRVNVSYNESGYAEIEPCERPESAGGTQPAPRAQPSATPNDHAMTDADIPF